MWVGGIVDDTFMGDNSINVVENIHKHLAETYVIIF